jgi:hypothetical protein
MVRVVTISLLAVLLACNQLDPPGSTCDAGAGEGTGLLYPLQEGAWWRFKFVQSDVGSEAEKVVEIRDSGPIPGREEEEGFMAYSLRDDGHGERWQAVTEEGHIVRHVDEWFDLEGNRTRIDYFCPPKYRVPDPESDFAAYEVYSEASVQLAEDAPADWTVCEAIELNPDTCEAANVPAGCEVVREENEKHWRSEGEEEVTVPARDEPFSAYRIEHDEAASFPGPKSYFWARGVGKVKEHDPGHEDEELLECCLPSAGCLAAAPPVG